MLIKQTKETKICSFTQKGTKINFLIRRNFFDDEKYYDDYLVLLNRKQKYNGMSEIDARKIFAHLVQYYVLQLNLSVL